MKAFKFLLLLLFAGAKLWAQDVVLISEGNFVRGVIKGTNYSSVVLMQDDQSLVQYQAKDIKSFIWNGETYESKPIISKKKADYRFFKLVEIGTVNLYAYGDKAVTTQAPAPSRPKIRPSFGVGLGSGGPGGGLGGGITFGGGGRRNDEMVNDGPKGKVSYFIERPGTGPMQEISLDAGKITTTRAILLQKLTNDEDLAQRINATESFDDKSLAAFIKAYNEMHKN